MKSSVFFAPSLIPAGLLLLCLQTTFAARLQADDTASPSQTAVSDAMALLQARCFECHGPDAREGGLRLSTPSDILLRNDSGLPAILPGDSQHSELVRRLTSAADDRMPPEGPSLSAEEVRTIAAWIDQGAPWPQEMTTPHQPHWAYIAPLAPEISPADAHSIDVLVSAKLQQHPSGLQPSDREQPARLLRRVFLDLTGLPPTPDQVAQFEADPSTEHFELIVDQLLASPRYGEKWARHWLDLARYADSNGYQADQFRSVWAYRDWVINAFNTDMPFDQFTIEQIAGDLLPNADVSQHVATGFHRLTTCNVEAGVDPEENRTNQVADRVTTTGTVWLGTTMECARCHNHKYDAFTQQDFYQLFAFFNNTPIEVEQQGDGVQFEVAGPMLQLPLPDEVQQQQSKQSEELAMLRQEVQDQMQALAAYDAQWEANQLKLARQQPQWHPLPITDFQSESNTTFERLEDNSILVTGPPVDKDVYTVTVDTQLANITGIRLEALTHPSLPGNGPGRKDPLRPNFVLYEVEAAIASASSGSSGEFDTPEPVRFRSARADYFQPKWNPAGLIDGKPTTGWAIGTEFGKAHEVVLLTSQPVGTDQGSRLTFRLPQHFGGGRLIGRLRLSALVGEPASGVPAASAGTPDDSGGTGAKPDDSGEVAAVPSGVSAHVLAALQTEVSQRTDEQTRAIIELRQQGDVRLAELNERIQQLEAALAEITPVSTAVMTEMPAARPTYIFKRGDFLTPGPEVSPGTPAVLHPFRPDTSEGSLPSRLDLARWLVSRDNPLTARVTVNRWWAEFFGLGIVDTLEDFGTQGSRPSHPELLDWLAVEFMDSGWSMKHIHKLIVTSATYQQSSRITPQQLEADPGNRLLARGPRFRLSAEVIRDNALAISGLLSDKMGGPPVYPPQPDNIWRHVGRNAPKYETDTSEDRFRRGIYVVWRRSAPYPSFVNFDAPDRASCVVSRSRSNTPLQALTLLNDPAYMEMAVALASRVLTECPDGDLRSRLEYAVRLCVARTPATEELLALQDLWTEEHERFTSNAADADNLVPRRHRLKSTPLAEQAAWCSVANVLLNLDEVITKN